MSDEFIDGLKKENIMFEDDDIIIYLPEKPAANGHLKVFTKKQYDCLEDVEEEVSEEMFYAASYAATALFEMFGGQVGTNIICNNALFMNKRPTMDVLARREKDGLDFQWKPKQMKPEDMDSVSKKIKDKADLIGVKVEKKEPENLDESTAEKIEAKPDEEDYTVSSLTRIP
jgi:diadenosine tetraphosphate (Ap4A) HIT family hydrolase